MGIRANGMGGARRRLNELADRIAGATAKAVDEFADEVVDHMKGLAPVDTGTLKESIEKKTEGGKVTVGPRGVDYAGYVENGTSRTPAQPYVAPTIQWAQQVGPRRIAAKIEGEIS